MSHFVAEVMIRFSRGPLEPGKKILQQPHPMIGRHGLVQALRESNSLAAILRRFRPLRHNDLPRAVSPQPATSPAHKFNQQVGDARSHVLPPRRG